ncbi:MAG: hypothetical protein JW746_10010 [Candidatus Krumholzibacteriota bacterium]|nr:hypothetical protein [Candidatus Krumholzibacteriota bacterium]
MRKSITALSIALSVLLLSCALAPETALAEKHEKLYGELKDIEGWKGKDPEGMAMDMPGMKMIQAMRIYTKGENEITAMIMTGSPAATGSFTPQGEMNFESSEGKASVKEIDGFTVHFAYDKEEHAGAITVLLDPEKKGASVFVLSYKDLSEEEAMKIAKRFDWKSIKSKVGSLE